MKRIFVVIGGPGFGKTTLVKALEAHGFHCEYDEKSREIIKSRSAVTSELEMNQSILRERIRQYDDAPDGTSFFDRGVPDGIAYMEKAPDDFWAAAKRCRYELTVFVTPPWKEIFKTEPGRAEASFDEAVRLHERITAVYKELGYRLMDVPRGPVQERAKFVLKAIEA